MKSSTTPSTITSARAIALAVAAFATFGCHSDVTDMRSHGDDGSGGGSSSGSGAFGSGNTSSGTAGSGSTGSGDEGCGGGCWEAECVTDDDCPGDQWCTYPVLGDCTEGFQAVCVAKVDDCSWADYDPVCGCDGQLYDSLCHTDMAGVNDATYSADCVEPEHNAVACETAVCREDTEYCVASLSSNGYPSGYCKQLPPECGSEPSCACLGVPDPGCACVEIDGGLRWNCQ